MNIREFDIVTVAILSLLIKGPIVKSFLKEKTRGDGMDEAEWHHWEYVLNGINTSLREMGSRISWMESRYGAETLKRASMLLEFVIDIAEPRDRIALLEEYAGMTELFGLDSQGPKIYAEYFLKNHTQSKSDDPPFLPARSPQPLIQAPV